MDKHRLNRQKQANGIRLFFPEAAKLRCGQLQGERVWLIIAPHSRIRRAGTIRLQTGEECIRIKQFSYVLTHEHAHRQTGLLREAARFESRIHLMQGGKAALLAGREPMELPLHSGSQVVVTVEGKDEEAAVAAIQNYFVANM